MMTDIIEVNINNLAAVPSIVFGLLGAAIFIGWMHLPLSAPQVGGLVLSLMTLYQRDYYHACLIKSGATIDSSGCSGSGCIKSSNRFSSCIYLALPGIMTGAIIGIAHALGETAPLLLIGMSAFVASIPTHH